MIASSPRPDQTDREHRRAERIAAARERQHRLVRAFDLIWALVAPVLVVVVVGAVAGAVIVTGYVIFFAEKTVDFTVSSVSFHRLAVGDPVAASNERISCWNGERFLVMARVDSLENVQPYVQDAYVSFTGRPVDGRSDEVISVRQHMDAKVRTHTLDGAYWWAPELPASFKGRPMTWTVTVDHADDLNRANDTMSSATLPPC